MTRKNLSQEIGNKGCLERRGDNLKDMGKNNRKETEDDNLKETGDDNLKERLQWADPGYHAAVMRRRYAARKAQGLCPICGKRPPYPGAHKCLQCATKQRSANRRYSNRQKEARRQGLTRE
jgi:hypothetical protein